MSPECRLQSTIQDCNAHRPFRAAAVPRFPGRSNGCGLPGLVPGFMPDIPNGAEIQANNHLISREVRNKENAAFRPQARVLMDSFGRIVMIFMISPNLSYGTSRASGWGHQRGLSWSRRLQA